MMKLLKIESFFLPNRPKNRKVILEEKKIWSCCKIVSGLTRPCTHSHTQGEREREREKVGLTQLSFSFIGDDGG